MAGQRRGETTPERPALAWWPVAAVAAGVVALLVATSSGYGYHRDELYFRMLGHRPQWGYVDQPPLTPLLVRLATELFGDTVWALRIPSALLVGVASIVLALIAREVGGGRLAQTLAATGTVTSLPLAFGHTMLTTTPDMVVWLLVILFAMRALLRNRPRLWLAAGLVTGIGLYNKHLVVLLLLAVGSGLLAVGPRRTLLSGWPWAGVAVALVVGSPNLVYQIVNGYPQAEMAAALTEDNAGEWRATLVPFQFILLGPPLVAIWIAGVVTLLRDPALRAVSAFAVAYPIMLGIVLVLGGQPYYPLGLVLALFAVGCVPAVRWLTAKRWRQALVGAGFVLNAVVSIVVALPIIPVGELGETPIPDLNQAARDQVGWPVYVRQVADAYRQLPEAERARTVIVTNNYGEAGALDRFGGAYGLPQVYSGHNELYFQRRPPESATVAILLVQDGQRLRASFGTCTEAGRLDNGVDVDNEEQSARIWVCRDPRLGWSELWPLFRHYD